MQYYPIQLDVRNRPCLVVGGGSVGTRKVGTLLACGARVTVVSPVVTDEIQRWADQGSIRWRCGCYEETDATNAFVVIGATDDDRLNERISRDAQRLGKLCNIADRPEFCNFILPSIVARGDLVITVSTSGKSPAFAKHVREQLQARFGPEYADFLELMGRIRKKLLSQAHEPEAHKHLFEKLIDRGLLDLVRDNNVPRIDDLLADVLGVGFGFEALMNENE